MGELVLFSWLTITDQDSIKDGLRRTLPYLLDNRQNPRLRIIVSIGTDAQIDLFIRCVLAVRPHQTEERVLGCLRDVGGGEDRRRRRRRHDVLRDGGKTLTGGRECAGTGTGTGTGTDS